MSIQKYDCNFQKLNTEVLSQWRSIPPAIVSDCMNRSNSMASRINPLVQGMRLGGQARTVIAMVGDNSAIHAAIGMLREGEVLVVDGQEYCDTALWGGVMTRAALKQKIGGVVIDGSVRDVAEIRELGFPIFVAGTVPAGPSKGFGGVIDGSISCGGVSVSPGDLVLGDDDGVAVVPLSRQEELLKASFQQLKNEESINKNTSEGILPFENFNLHIEQIN